MKRLSEVEFKSRETSIENTQNYELQEVNRNKLLASIKQFIPNAEFFYYINYYNELERICIEFQRDGITFRLKNNTDGKYSIDALTEHLSEITVYDKKKVSEKYVKPCFIGKFTVKKVNDWITYQTHIYNDLLVINQSAESKLDEFKKSIEGEKIQWSIDGKKGEIKRNGIIFKFEITSGYVSMRLELSSSISANYDNFISLSDNKYKG